ncbi:MAG: hypothetical protein ACYC91_10275 [Solirubrobacteraceae bacterium]
MSGETQLLLWIAALHILGLACVAVLMIPALRDEPDPPSQSQDQSDDGWGNNPRQPPSPRNLPGGGLPLPDAEPARLRLREHGRLHERLPGRERRPVREPHPAPVPAPERRRVRT